MKNSPLVQLHRWGVIFMKLYRGTEQSAQRIVNHIIHFRKTKAVPILRILNAGAEQRKQHRD